MKSHLIGFAAAITVVISITAVPAHPGNLKTENLGNPLSALKNGSFHRFSRCYDHLNPKQKAQLENKNGVIGSEYRWPGGVVPYAWDSSANDDDRAYIREGMQMIEAATCIRFTERTDDENYVLIKTDDPSGGCFSESVGMWGGSQVLNLERDGCNTASTAAHELIHNIGFFHEHQRQDRDDYITIMWDNIQKQWWSAFDNTFASDTYGVRYNVLSIMHYEAYSTFGIDLTKPVMVSKDPNNPIPPTQDAQPNQVMDTDAQKINLMYADYCG